MNRIEKILRFAFTLVMLIFLASWGIYYYRYQNQLSKDIFSEQEKIAKLTSNALGLYFDKLKFAVESTVTSPAFDYEQNIKEDSIRFLETTDRTLQPIEEANYKVWNYFKGLPERYENKEIASERRAIARNILKNYADIHYVFEMDLNGDLVFLEPYATQQKITGFNYKFRDYLKLVQKSGITSISEGYISHDKDRTHIITVATPIKDKSGEVKKVFAASISAKTLHSKVLSDITAKIGTKEKYKVSLIDKHGHIVANSYNLTNYHPEIGAIDDNNDVGNLRKYGIFDKIEWQDDIFEKNNLWERKTKIWNLDSDHILTHQYSNQDKINVFGTLYPINIYENGHFNWGVLVESPMDSFYLESMLTLLGFVISFILISVLLYLIYRKVLRQYRIIESDVKKAEDELTQLAKKVRHDIRSPLSAMEYLFQSIKPKLEEEERLIGSSSLERINDIILTLSNDENVTTKNTNDEGVEILYPLINRVIAEKRLEYKSIEGIIIKLINNLEYGVFVKINKSDLARTISNLLNNAVEAKKNNKSLSIKVELSNDQDNCFIKITDNGIGIDKVNLEKIFEYGTSFNKATGRGIGLSQAKDHINKAQGSIEINSEMNVGTTVQISLPRMTAPKWFQSKLEFNKKNLCIVDDDDSIHLLWAKKLSSFDFNIINIKSSEEFELWAEWNNLDDYNFLFDLELLGSKHTGIDLIKKFNLSKFSTLVTSHYSDHHLQKQVNDLGFKIIPKDLASDVPINLSLFKDNVVLIDDDKLVHMSWKRALSSQNVELHSFYDVDEFLSQSDRFDFNIPMYIDSNLGNGRKGEIESEKIYLKGFTNLTIATGYDPESVQCPSWIKRISGKEVPNNIVQRL